MFKLQSDCYWFICMLFTGNQEIALQIATELPFKVPGPISLCPPIDDDEETIPSSKSETRQITFIESSGEECLTPRQACGIESAARTNPEMLIRIYTNSDRTGLSGWDDRVMRPGRVRSCAFNRILLNLTSHNIRFIRENFTHRLAEEKSFRRHLDEMKKSPFWVVQVSDAMRLILLKKHGGLYLDFDNIVFRPLHCLRNSLSYLEEEVHIENGVMV